MPDNLAKEKRSWNMSLIRAKNTKPEIMVRKALHAAGFRFRLHVNDLPGKPDVVLPKWNTVIFVHGCFWHRHAGCKRCSNPKSNQDYWENKFRNNLERDKKHQEALEKQGWKVIVLWECLVSDPVNWLDNAIKMIKRCKKHEIQIG